MRSNRHFPIGRLFFLSLLLVAWTAAPAHAQIELDQDGHVGIIEPPTQNSGLHVEVTEVVGDNRNGVYSYVHGSQGATGVYGRASGGDSNTGVYGYASYSGDGTPALYGVRGEVEGYGYSFGVYGDGNDEGYGIYGTGGSSAGYFSGDVTVTGNFSNPSDRKFKRNIQSLAAAKSNSGDDATSKKLFQLQPKKFRYKTNQFEEMGFPMGEQFGLVAQEVEDVFPTLVSEEVHPPAEEGGEPITYKSVNYMQLVPLLLQSMKEQQAENESLRNEVETLKEALQRQGIQVE